MTSVFGGHGWLINIFAQGEPKSAIGVRGAVVVQVERAIIRVGAIPIRVEGVPRIEVLVVPAGPLPCSKPMPKGFFFPFAAYDASRF